MKIIELLFTLLYGTIFFIVVFFMPLSVQMIFFAVHVAIALGILVGVMWSS